MKGRLEFPTTSLTDYCWLCVTNPKIQDLQIPKKEDAI